MMNAHAAPQPLPWTGHLFAYPFRVFFLAGSLWAILAVVLWIAHFRGLLTLPLAIAGSQWHAHAMIHGMTSAMIGGFLLTAMANWTGTVAPSGHRLLALFALWLLGRFNLLFSAGTPETVLILLSVAFYLALAAYAANVLLRTGNHRNLIMPVVIGLLAVSDGWLLQAALQADMAGIRGAQSMALYPITLLMVVIAGRITPAFSVNWLRQQGHDATPVRRVKVIELGGVLAIAVLAIADIAGAPDAWVAALALLAGALHTVRLVSWKGWRVLRNPLLSILHLGYLALTVSLFMRAAAAWLPAVPLSAWFHLVGIGAMGILIIGVMTRVALGHTGRPLSLPWLGLVAYVAMLGAVIARTITLLSPQLGYHTWLLSAAGFWIVSFIAFLLAYAPILLKRRADGQPG